jgi:murein DD-endopeptidase MepM/ murein hydrolase activator NlpD
METRRPERWRTLAIALAVMLTAACTVWLASGLVRRPSGSIPPAARSPNAGDTLGDPPGHDTIPRSETADSAALFEREDPAPLEMPATLADSSIEAVARVVEMRELAMPVAGVTPDRLIDTYNQARSEGRVHNAIDIMAPLGTPVVAVADATVLKLFESVNGGTTLYLLDDDGRTVYYYAHLDRYADGIQEGRRVRRGETIAFVGDTGNATPGNFHLHFEITIVDDPKTFYRGASINPYPILRRAR